MGLAKFVPFWGHYSSHNLSSVLYLDSTDAITAVKMEVYTPPAGTKPTFEEASKSKYKPVKKGESFGPSWSNHWFKIAVKVPKEWAKYKRVQFEFDPGCEGLIYTPQGLPVHAIVGGYSGLRRVEYVLDEHSRQSTHHFYIEISCNGMFGVPQGGNEIEPPDPNRTFSLDKADLIAPNLEAWALMYDFNLLSQIATSSPSTPICDRALNAANEIMSTFRAGDDKTIGACRKIAERILGDGWEKDGAQVWEKGQEKGAGLMWGLGHCHIDTFWLWPASSTKQKVARSWSSQIYLMSIYPEHHFSATSAQHFQWLERLYPKLFDAVKENITKKGQFGVVGGTWVEMDTNIPSGEALCRQFLYGQNFFKSRFGDTCDTFVLPDTFGYSSQLPQIARLSGANNKFPHTSFNWAGIDGSQILTHMTPVDTYNAQADYGEIMKGATANKNLEVTGDALYLFGNGDGGGGPTAPMLEKLRRLRAVANENPGVPVVKMGGHMDDFFERLQKSTDNGKKLPSWKGELYFELHRGTYTSHGLMKRDNRTNELLLRDVEYLSTMASLEDETGSFQYPKSKLDWCWEHLLLCQQHDVLPGSAIRLAYDEAERYHVKIRKLSAEMIDAAYRILLPNSTSLADNPLVVAGKGKIVGINTLRVPRREVVKVPVDAKGALKGSMAQVCRGGTHGYLLVDATNDGLAEVKGVFADMSPVSATHESTGEFVLKSSSIIFTIKDGRISSIFDVELERELIAEGETGGLVIYEDMPNYWDAWDVEIFHLETPTRLKFSSVSIAENGPLRATLAVKAQVGKSTIGFNISLDAVGGSTNKGSRSLIRFESADINWRERHKFLKFELPTDISSAEATYETQFGTVSRPTHRNTSWDQAKFEVCAHKFADLSEFGYGVGIVNDCKYGHAVEGGVMRLSLLRSSTAPDAEQDQGAHQFSFGIYPHTGSFLESDLPRVAAAFNSSLHLRYIPDTLAAMKTITTSSLNFNFAVDGGRNVLAETIKRAENDKFSSEKGVGKGEKNVIVRLYEAFGGQAKVSLKLTGFNVTSAVLTNILEEPIGKPLGLKVDGFEDELTSVELKFRAFEIKTLKLTIAEKPTRDASLRPTRLQSLIIQHNQQSLIGSLKISTTDMPSKTKGPTLTKAQQKAAAKASKKAAQSKKGEKKETKKAKGKGKGKEADEDDLEAILDSFQKEWETKHAVKEEIASGPPSRRANATFTACPSGNYLWCIGGEYYDGDRATFYNDVYRYQPEKDEWRLFASPNSPGPRSAHCCVASPSGGGKLYIFGGEYASPKQTSFHHFRDFWEFDVNSHEWERIETKVKPSPRSGCRMAMWKHFIVLFGGFYDLGVRTNYLDDLWVFDTQLYKWKQVEFPVTAQRPRARSGFSLLPAAEGVVLHGGYCKVFEKGKRTKGIALEDTWLLRMDPDDIGKFKWEKRRRSGYPPSVRSGCSMTLWGAKNMGVLFGGVWDDDRDEETLESVFYNDLHGYSLAHPGRWVTMNLKKPKKKAGGGRRKAKVIQAPKPEDQAATSKADEAYNTDDEVEEEDYTVRVVEEEDDPDDPQKSIPLTRYNTMMAIIKNTLYIYGGIFENDSREYTLDDFYSLSLDKLERYNCLRSSGLEEEAWLESEEEDGDSDESDEEDEEEGGSGRRRRGGGDDDEEDGEGGPEGEEYVKEEEEEDDDGGDEVVGVDENGVVMTRREQEAKEAALREEATKFLGVSKDAARSLEDTLSTPLPGEVLRDFYDRTREYWTGKAHSHSDNRGKMLRKDGFEMASQRYAEYEPILKEIERIQREAGLEAEDMGKGGPATTGGVGEASRNRR
ncbi:glycoside hydrolase family 38 protein [Phaffia rhodozyma]|uniref:Alpha-mannosidase n=1 Tax=Phaffia rhodozyma TaxID=264483 RepID=A0A0F7SV05_PHARH|nr:glycoside hydrolase family 38 protein [Phaffia rhodozyma]